MATSVTSLASSAAPARKAVWLGALLIAGAALIAYHNSFYAPFVFDDMSSIEGNATIRTLWPLSGPLTPPTTNVTAQGRPILNLSLAINYALGGTSVVGYHVGNLLIHTLAGLALFGLLRRTLKLAKVATDATLPALAIALLWVVHPLQTESVTYIIQRAESLLGLFYLLTFYCFARSTTEAGARATVWQGLAVIACALGMGTKEVMATAPLMVLFYDRTFVAPTFLGALRRRPIFYAALFGTWLLLGWLIAQGGGNRGGSVGFGAGVDAVAYWLTQLKAMATYLRLTFWPAPLVFEYGTFWIERASEIWFDALLVLGLLALTIRGLWRRTPLGFAGAWFFGILAPTSLAPGTTQMIVEHRMYLSLAAVLAVAVIGARRLLEKRPIGAAYGAVALAALAALVLTALTIRRNADYRTDIALWSDTLAKRPANPLAHFMLAGAWERASDPARAEASYREALRLKPNFSVGHENYGALLLKLGRVPEAIPHLETALQLQPEFADAHANLGNALLAEGRAADAARHLAEAVRLSPGFFETHYNFANALAASGQFEAAVVQYERALVARTGVAEVHFNLANVLMELRRLPEAIGQYRAAVQARPDYATAHYNLGNALALSRQPAEAVVAYEAALRARPNYPEAHHNLASACFELGRFAEAERHYAATLELAPDFPNARANLERVRKLRR